MTEFDRTPLVVAVCDPERSSLALTRAMVQRALDELYVRRLASVRAYPTPASLLAAPPCDVCVLSADWEDADVFQLLEAVRRRRRGAGAVFVSRALRKDVARQAGEAGVCRCLPRPIESDEDFARLKAALGQLCELCLRGREGLG